MLIPHFLHSQILDELDFSKDYPLSLKLRFRCRINPIHEFTAELRRQIKNPPKCPICLNKKLVVGVNDLKSTHPELSFEWDYEKNTLNIESVHFGTRKHAWWKCPQGHSWKALIANRGRLNVGCPVCAGKVTLQGFNDLGTKHPEVLEYWDWNKNSDSPYDVPQNSGKEFWWKCSKNHSYLRRSHEFIRGRGCPVCANRRVTHANSLLSQYPKLSKEWHPRNTLTPAQIVSGSSSKVWWLCAEGHEWEAKVYTRTRNSYGCPFCSGRKSIQGKTDLVTLNPQLASEWHSKNTKRPTEVTIYSEQKVWWLCALNHEWEARVSDRTRGTGCPICVNLQLLQGFNDLSTRFPELLEEWDYRKNEILPTQIVYGSHRKVWWRCQKGHEWFSAVIARTKTKNPTGCPYCSNRISRAETEVADFIKSVLPSAQVRTSVRDVISPKELDIYIPELKMAVEFNGLYWHTEAQGKDRNYHLNKYLECERKGIRLLQIWEDEWRDKQEIVKSLLKSKLGVDDRERVFARKTSVHVITKDEARDFLDTHHIQGFASGSYYLALKTVEDELVAVMVLRKLKAELYLDRYATSKHVIGGQSKLLKWAEQNVEFTQLVTFADLQISDGGLYEATGWVQDKVLKPDYRYLVDGQRVHKFNYRLKRFRNDPNLQWVGGLSERQLAALNGLERVWDSGKIRYVKKK